MGSLEFDSDFFLWGFGEGLLPDQRSVFIEHREDEAIEQAGAGFSEAVPDDDFGEAFLGAEVDFPPRCGLGVGVGGRADTEIAIGVAVVCFSGVRI